MVKRPLMSLILQIVEILLAFRLIFKFLGANPQSGLVRTIYALTHVLMSPFTNVFPTVVGSVDTILEPATLLALVMYPLLVLEITQLLAIVSSWTHQKVFSLRKV